MTDEYFVLFFPLDALAVNRRILMYCNARWRYGGRIDGITLKQRETMSCLAAFIQRT